MTAQIARGDELDTPALQADVVAEIRDAGVAGAGGAGFPTYSKWERADEADYLLMNHQESEPNYCIDKWLGEAHAAEFAALFDRVLDELFEVVVVGAKWKDREQLHELEALTGGAVRTPDDLPLDPEDESGVVFAYTGNTYQYGMESVLLNVVADTVGRNFVKIFDTPGCRSCSRAYVRQYDTVIGDDLPMDHGWIVQNTETLHNVYRAWTDGTPVTRTYVHVGGNVPQHRFLDVPIGTPVRDILDEAQLSRPDQPPDTVLAHGGPGWCFRMEGSADSSVVRKHTNCIMVLDSETVEENTLGGDRIDVLDADDWGDRDLETEPTARVEPADVRIPLITNTGLEGAVRASKPAVSAGDEVEAGEPVASPNAGGVSIPQHASIDGTVTAVDEAGVRIRSHGPE